MNNIGDLILHISPAKGEVVVEREIEGVMARKTINPDDLANCFLASRYDDERHPTGLLPEGCIGVTIMPKYTYYYIRYPELRVDFSYFGTLYPNFPIPRLVFCLKYMPKEKKVAECYVCVAKDERLKEDTPLYHYPFSNVYTAITKYLYDAVHNHEFASKMASKPGTTITIEIFQKDKAEFVSFEDKTVDNPLDRSSSGRKIASVKLYHKQDMTLIDSFQLLPPPLGSEADNRFSAKERMVLIYLEEIVCYFILQAGITPPAYQGEDTYSSRKQHLMNVLESVEQTDFHLAKEIIAGIEAIPNRYFENNRVRATIPLQEMSENFLIALAQGLDESLLENHEINHRYFVRMSFVGISTGEAQYIDLYATLYHAIKSSNHPKGDTCVLLLDEPDCGFHPEWSRNFILNLTELLNADVFRNYNYQVIITTHSPFLVSDVPKESVHCLHRDKDGSISIKSSQHGLLSNLNDLITDSFFADSIFGAFAEQYANKLISDIAVAEVQPEFVPEDQLAELRSRLDRIEDRVIWQSLNWKLCRLEARAR